MTSYVALLRAVNVGGTGKLAMTDLVAMCREAGFADPRTYIASGNVVFGSNLDEAGVRAALEARLQTHAGKPVGVIVRTADEMAEAQDSNPFADEPGNRVVAFFTDAALPTDPLDGLRHRQDERLALGPRCLYIAYGDGMAASKLVVPAAKTGTARNMNTVAKLAAMAAATA